MEMVEPGNVIFMFAKGVGIIGIGKATGRCETLNARDPDRVSNIHTTIEWRIPTQWLAWTDANDAYPWKSPNCTFWDVSESQYEEFRSEVIAHFLNEE